MKFLLGLISIAGAVSAHAFAEPAVDFSKYPSWFPKVRCADQGDTSYQWREDILQTDLGNKDYWDHYRKIKRNKCFKEWSVLIYMAADNDLTPYALADLYEMEAGYRDGSPLGASQQDSDVLVELDTRGNDGIRRLHMYQRPDGEAFDPTLNLNDFKRMEASSIRSPIVRVFEEDGEHETRFRQFLKWGIRSYPALKTAVIIWGHGQGWAPEVTEAQLIDASSASPEVKGVLSSFPESLPDPTGSVLSKERKFGGIAFDESDGGFLSIPTIRKVLSQMTEHPHYRKGRPFDIYASDACLMQMVEVSTEISPFAQFIVGSAQVQTYFGLPYRLLFEKLNQNPSVSPYEVAQAVPNLTQASLTDPRFHGKLDPQAAELITISALHSHELQYRLIPELNELGISLTELLEGPNSRQAKRSLKTAIKNTPGFMGGAKALGVFLTVLKIQLSLDGAPQARRLDQAIRQVQSVLFETVVSRAVGTKYVDQEGLHLAGFRGVSIWLPRSSTDYLDRSDDFESSDFYRRAPAWNQWLESLYGFSF